MTISNVYLFLLDSESASSHRSVQVFPPGYHLFYRMCLSSGKSVSCRREQPAP